jgi:unsaturated rhamnogalacturonyl hydrolase
MTQKPTGIFIALILLLASGLSAQKQVVLDYYFNCEISAKTNAPFHYIWDDKSFGGYSELGDIFKQEGAAISLLNEKPTCKNIKVADVFIIVDPDHAKDAPNPNYMDKKAANAIAKWVKKGGVLLLFTNDSSNCELEKFNLLSSKFGITYNRDFNHPELRGADKKIRNFQSCASVNLPNHPIFKEVSKIFIKEISSIQCSKQAKPILTEQGKVYMAEANYGKGYVFAIGDPWLYNEYIDHALLPQDFENKKAAVNLVKYVLAK